MSSSAKQKEWYYKNREYRIAYNKAWKSKNPDKVKEYSRRRSLNHRTTRTAYAKQERIKLRHEVVNAYGAHCACCGEKEFVFLEIDHVNNNGAEERKRLYGSQRNSGGLRFYRRLRKLGYPSEYQILCRNCNWAKHRGGCPHQSERT